MINREYDGIKELVKIALVDKLHLNIIIQYYVFGKRKVDIARIYRVSKHTVNSVVFRHKTNGINIRFLKENWKDLLSIRPIFTQIKRNRWCCEVCGKVVMSRYSHIVMRHSDLIESVTQLVINKELTYTTLEAVLIEYAQKYKK